MAPVPASIAEFLKAKRIAVAGVSRGATSAANPVYRKLRAAGYEAIPVNPHAAQLEGVTCYPGLASIPGEIDAVMIATHPDVSIEIVRQAAERGVKRVWMHRAFGRGSVSEAAVRECERLDISCIAGACPLMFVEPVDVGHKCLRWWLGRKGRVPR